MGTWSTNNNHKADAACSTVTNGKGIWSDCPASTIHSTLLSRAASASSKVSQIHSKHDNGQYSCATTPGFCPTTILNQVTLGKSGNGIPSVYYAKGEFPTAPPDKVDFFSVVSNNNDRSLAVMAAKYYSSQHMILITAGSNYRVLNGTQCEVHFETANFNVTVGAIAKHVTVFPSLVTARDAAEPPFDPTLGIAMTVTDQINSLAMITTTLYTSIVGDAFVANIAAMTGKPSNSTLSSNEESLKATEDSVTAMVDELLLFVGSSQFFVPDDGAGDFFKPDARLTVQAVRLGDATYMHLIFVTCGMLLVTMLLEAFRTKGWRYLPRWDFQDLSCIILSTAVIGEDVVGGLYQIGRGRYLQWTGGDQWWEAGVDGNAAPAPGDKEDLPEIHISLGKKNILLSTPFDEQGIFCYLFK
ncbi:hypothetical protein TruAng_010556 [Truncatella angustata]|nr:hypothetical protein TruAng_010556 [Truncatella angustata]